MPLAAPRRGGRKEAGLLVLFLALAGCSADHPCASTDARGDMVGMSLSEIATCLGPPGNKTSRAETETWTYTYGTCTLDLDIAHKRVSAAGYMIQANGVSESEQCEKVPVVTSCLKWLRSPSIFEK